LMRFAAEKDVILLIVATSEQRKGLAPFIPDFRVSEA
jgi:hypothetical protein